VVDLKRGGEGKTNREPRLRRLKGQAVLGNEQMLLRDDLDEQIMMFDGDVRCDLGGGAGYTENAVAEEYEKKKTGKRDSPTSGWH
jgi:hypothetical protein